MTPDLTSYLRSRDRAFHEEGHSGRTLCEDDRHPDVVEHPKHYTVGGIETIDFIKAKRLGYELGNVVKYVSRAKYKGEELTDLKKARYYLNRAIEELEKNGQ